MKTRTSWNEDSALFALKKWIDDGKWDGTTHFRKNNTSVYEYLYRTIGLESAFEKLGLNYADFKKSVGKRTKIRPDEEVINELHSLTSNGNWKGIRHLQINHSTLYTELSRIGFKNAFNKLGLDYKNFRYATWSQQDILNELKEMINKGEWQGVLHLKKNNSKLYNAISRDFGFPKAFSEIGLNYDDYRKYRRRNNTV